MSDLKQSPSAILQSGLAVTLTSRAWEERLEDELDRRSGEA